MQGCRGEAGKNRVFHGGDRGPPNVGKRLIQSTNGAYVTVSN
jgi:hypothetical protein